MILHHRPRPSRQFDVFTSIFPLSLHSLDSSGCLEYTLCVGEAYWAMGIHADSGVIMGCVCVCAVRVVVASQVSRRDLRLARSKRQYRCHMSHILGVGFNSAASINILIPGLTSLQPLAVSAPLTPLIPSSYEPPPVDDT
ncbi:hypothetical protein E1B28_002962 [Marasmius oreades]|uniref:Uncharacterized protein n=1 Tax=Marasmius oreades TaxID=181124 RepID=A0A9P7RLF7_9AGAR|nr:uncharacterized protein E1B28_002962 [Marasmius oreades]KAG7085401.1 hypothetical protein E1B28_002962 [Marasmius oreades]